MAPDNPLETEAIAFTQTTVNSLLLLPPTLLLLLMTSALYAVDGVRLYALHSYPCTIQIYTCTIICHCDLHADVVTS